MGLSDINLLCGIETELLGLQDEREVTTRWSPCNAAHAPVLWFKKQQILSGLQMVKLNIFWLGDFSLQ